MFSYWFPLWSPTVNRQCFSDWITLIRTSTRTYQDSPILSICLFVCLFVFPLNEAERMAGRVVWSVMCAGGREGGAPDKYQLPHQTEYKWWSDLTPGQGPVSPSTCHLADQLEPSGSSSLSSRPCQLKSTRTQSGLSPLFYCYVADLQISCSCSWWSSTSYREGRWE